MNNERLLMLALLTAILLSWGCSTKPPGSPPPSVAPGTDTTAVARGQASTRAAMVLSELRDRADARAGELAKAYDQARIAGQVCERSYNALIN
jgi:hypothetical protein